MASDRPATAGGTDGNRGNGGASGSGSDVLVRVADVHRVYGSGDTAVRALRGASLEVRRGELLALRGRSGAGKSTLLNIIGGLDRATSGSVHVAGLDVTAMSHPRLLRLRRDTISFVFQSFGLIPMLTAAENVGVPMRLTGTPSARREERSRALLRLVGLGEHTEQRAYELSGGQQQRVALARALANQPQLVIADEPTGQLDSATGRQIMRLLRTLVHAEGVTALIATHDAALMEVADRVLVIADGVVTEQDDVVSVG
jgi:putative ABC transport system ATP-binding protein